MAKNAEQDALRGVGRVAGFRKIRGAGHCGVAGCLIGADKRRAARPEFRRGPMALAVAGTTCTPGGTKKVTVEIRKAGAAAGIFFFGGRVERLFGWVEP